VVIDVTSMVDVILANKLVKAVAPGAHLLLVGDVDQLPSVGAGEVLRDLIGAPTLPVVTLTRIFRQAQQSGIVVNAHTVNAGRPPPLTGYPASRCYDRCTAARPGHLPSVHLLSKYSGQEPLWAADATRGGLEPLLSLEEDAAPDVDGTKSVGLLARTVAVAVGAASVHRDSQVPKSRVMPCPTRPRPPSQKTNEPVARVDSLPASST